MKPEKRNKYTMTPSIHTLEVKCDVNAIQKTDSNEFMEISVDGKKEIATLKLNPNNWENDLFCYEHFYNVLDALLDDIGVQQYKLSRADLRLDNSDPAHYRAFEKLNRYLISALAVTYHVKNCYSTSNLFNDKQVSLAIKNSYFQAEHYDRAYKNAVTKSKKNNTCSRLELRSVNKEFARFISCYADHDANMSVLKQAFCEHWINRLHKATTPECMAKVQERYNQELLEEYKTDKMCKSLSEFIRQNHKRIFTSKQLRSLLMQIGLTDKKASTFARNFKNRNAIEYFSQKDVDFAVKVIERTIFNYFGKSYK